MLMSVQQMSWNILKKFFKSPVDIYSQLCYSIFVTRYTAYIVKEVNRI